MIDGISTLFFPVFLQLSPKKNQKKRQPELPFVHGHVKLCCAVGGNNFRDFISLSV